MLFSIGKRRMLWIIATENNWPASMQSASYPTCSLEFTDSSSFMEVIIKDWSLHFRKVDGKLWNSPSGYDSYRPLASVFLFVLLWSLFALVYRIAESRLTDDYRRRWVGCLAPLHFWKHRLACTMSKEMVMWPSVPFALRILQIPIRCRLRSWAVIANIFSM